MVNQASITGESIGRASSATGGPCVRRHGGGGGPTAPCAWFRRCRCSGRYDRVVRMIEESEKLKSTTEEQGRPLWRTGLVPYTSGRLPVLIVRC